MLEQLFINLCQCNNILTLELDSCWVVILMSKVIKARNHNCFKSSIIKANYHNCFEKCETVYMIAISNKNIKLFKLFKNCSSGPVMTYLFCCILPFPE